MELVSSIEMVIIGVVFYSMIFIIIYALIGDLIKLFKFLFICRNYKITGRIIEMDHSPAAYITVNSSPEVMSPGANFYIRFFIKINEHISNSDVIIEVSKELYDSLHVNEETTIPCKKREWEKGYEEMKLYSFA